MVAAVDNDNDGEPMAGWGIGVVLVLGMLLVLVKWRQSQSSQSFGGNWMAGMVMDDGQPSSLICLQHSRCV